MVPIVAVLGKLAAGRAAWLVGGTALGLGASTASDTAAGVGRAINYALIAGAAYGLYRVLGAR